MPRSRLTLLSWVAAIAFVLGTVFFLVDRFNIVATPPEFPETSTMVDRVLGSAAYAQAIWPIFLWTNLLFAAGFVAAVAFAMAAAPASGVRGGLPIFVALATTGGIIGAIASIIPIGAADAKVWLGYCDCVSKEIEITSQVWAQMIANDIGNWFNRVSSVVLGLGLIALVREGGSVVSPRLRMWTYLTAIVLLVVAILAIVQRFDPLVADVLTVLAGAVLVPVWVVWLARDLDARPESAA